MFSTYICVMWTRIKGVTDLTSFTKTIPLHLSFLRRVLTIPFCIYVPFATILHFSMSLMARSFLYHPSSLLSLLSTHFYALLYLHSSIYEPIFDPREITNLEHKNLGKHEWLNTKTNQTKDKILTKFKYVFWKEKVLSLN